MKPQLRQNPEQIINQKNYNKIGAFDESPVRFLIKKYINL